MRSIIWKEIRENLKWAVLLMLVGAAAFTISLYDDNMPALRGYEARMRIESVFVTTLFGAAGVAGLLGLLQIVPELWRDQWAFLVHRPMTRTRLFFSKVIAGLLLYGIVVLLPLLGALIWLVMPGHLGAPFHWRMCLPWIASILSGITFYFAAVLTGVRQARWYGSRALPFALAAICQSCVFGASEFWQTLLVTAVSLAVLITAAWGSFVASGQYRSQPAIAKAALGVVLCVGVYSIGIPSALLVVQWLNMGRGRPWAGYRIDKEGRVLRFSCVNTRQPGFSVTDLAGNPVDKFKDNRVSHDEIHQHSLRFSMLRWGVAGSYLRTSYRDSGRFFRDFVTTKQAIWYFAPFERLLVGYDRQTRRRIGTIGPEGFSPAGTLASQTFPDEEQAFPFWRNRDLLAFPSGVYHINFRKCQVKMLLEGTPDEPILGGDIIETGDGRHNEDGPIGIATAGRVHLFSEALKPLASFVCQYPFDEYPNLRAAALPKGGYVFWYQTRSWVTPELPGHVVIVSDTGTQLNHYELPPIPRCRPAYAWPDVTRALVMPVGGYIVHVSSHYLLLAWFSGVELVQWMRHIQHDLFSNHATVLFFAGVGAVFWALLVFGVARRYAFSKRQRIWWTVAGFLLGPAGLLTLIVLREWPARITCTSCGRKRLVDREQCEHCAAAFAEPKPTGTEIFDEPQSVNSVTAQ